MVKAVEKLQNGVQNLADILNMKVPTLPTAASASKSGLQIVDSGPAFGSRDGEDMQLHGGIWDDDEERKFYEDILDLGTVVPPSFLGLKVNGEVEEPEITVSSPAKPASLHLADDTEQGEPTQESEEHLTDLDDEQPPTVEEELDPLQSGPAARLQVLFAALPEANNRAVIDKLATDFAYLNLKPARKRCAKVSVC
jgi:regulator of nonsense transcripts 2